MDILSEKTFFTKKINVTLIALFCMILWGTAAPVIKVGFDLFKIQQLEIYSKILFAGLRFVIGGIIVILIFSLREKRLLIPSKKSIPDIISIGLVQTTLQFSLFYIGLAYTTGLKASIFSALTTFFAVGIAHFFYKDDRLNLKKSLGCIIGFLGILILSLGGKQNDSTGFSLIGDGLVILSMIAYAIATVMCKEASKRGNIITVTGYSLLFGGLILVIIGVIGGGILENVSIAGILTVFYLGFLTAVALTLYNLLLKYNNVSLINMYNFLVPVFGTIFSAVLLNESVFTLKNIISLTLACIGILVVNLPDKVRNKNDNT